MKIKYCLKLSTLVILVGACVAAPRALASGDDAAEVQGTIQSLPSGSLIGDWRVANRTIHVTSSTRIDQEHGQAAVGAVVEVKGTPQSDGSITATRIEVKS